MAESSTPTKISARNPVCRLCGDSHETRYMLRIFSKAGSDKDLSLKVHNCGIVICEGDVGSKVLCRRCVAFLYKMEDFIMKAQAMQNEPDDHNPAEYSVKRCVELSPSSRQPSKRLSTLSTSTRTSAKQLSFSAPQAAPTVLMPKPTEGTSNCTTFEADLLTERQQKMIVQAVSSKDPVVLSPTS